MVGPHGRTTSWDHSAAGYWQTPAARLSRIAIACVITMTCAGCVGISARDARVRNAVEDGWERVETHRGLDVSLETVAVLARQHLSDRGPARPGPRGPICSRLVFRLKPSPTGRLPWLSCLITSA